MITEGLLCDDSGGISVVILHVQIVEYKAVFWLCN